MNTAKEQLKKIHLVEDALRRMTLLSKQYRILLTKSNISEQQKKEIASKLETIAQSLESNIQKYEMLLQELPTLPMKFEKEVTEFIRKEKLPTYELLWTRFFSEAQCKKRGRAYVPQQKIPDVIRNFKNGSELVSKIEKSYELKKEFNKQVSNMTKGKYSLSKSIHRVALTLGI